MILRRLPRFMLFVVSKTSRRLKQVCHTIRGDSIFIFASPEGLEYLEILARNSPAKWVCSLCYKLHSTPPYNPHYGPCDPLKTKCPKLRAHLMDSKKKGWPVAPFYDHRFIQFVLKYRRLCKEPEWSKEHWCSFFHLIMQPVKIKYKHWSIRGWDPHQRIVPRIEGDSFYIDRTLTFEVPEGFSLLQGPPYGERWICGHQPFCAPGWWRGFSEKERKSFVASMKVARDGRRYEPPSSNPPAYQYCPVGDGNDWVTVAQAAMREPKKFFEGSCYDCNTRFGVKVESTSVEVWCREYIGSESISTTDAFKKSQHSRVQDLDTSSGGLALP